MGAKSCLPSSVRTSVPPTGISVSVSPQTAPLRLHKEGIAIPTGDKEGKFQTGRSLKLLGMTWTGTGQPLPSSPFLWANTPTSINHLKHLMSPRVYMNFQLWRGQKQEARRLLCIQSTFPASNNSVP